jgi:hypothetical protein
MRFLDVVRPSATPRSYKSPPISRLRCIVMAPSNLSANDFVFEGAFRVERADLPSDISRVRGFGSRGARGGTNSALLRVTPARGEAWIGAFDGGMGDWSQLDYGPTRKHLLVVANGAAHIVDVENPAIYHAIELMPVTQVARVADRDVLLLADWWRIAAYGAEGHLWTSERIALDGLTIQEATKQVITGVSLGLPGLPDLPFTVETASGRVSGGHSAVRKSRRSLE